MKTQNAIFGRSRKSFGSATAYTMNGQNIVRTKPIAVANPRTDAQTAQRVRFNAFTKTANALPEDELNALIPDKELGRNRRTTLQAQLAPAYGAQENSDPTAAERIVPTFDYTKLGDLGTGEVGYTGDLVSLPIANGIVTLSEQNFETIVERMVNTNANEEVAMVAISEDGCMLQVKDLHATVESILNDLAELHSLTYQFPRLGGHGSTVKAWVTKKKERLQLIGLGTFSVAKRTASGTHNVIPS